MEVVQPVDTRTTTVATNAFFRVDVTTPTNGSSQQRPKNSIHFLLNSNDTMDECSPTDQQQQKRNDSHAKGHPQSTASPFLQAQSPPKAPLLSPSEVNRRRKLSRRGGRAYDEQLTNIYDQDECEGEDEHAMRLFLLQQREKGKRLPSAHTPPTPFPTSSSSPVPSKGGCGLLDNFPLPAHSIEQLLPLVSCAQPSSPSYFSSPNTGGGNSNDPIGSPQLLRVAQKNQPLKKSGEFSPSLLQRSSHQQQELQQQHSNDQRILLHPPLSPAGETTPFGSSQGSSPCPGSPILAHSALLSPSNRHSHQLVPATSTLPTRPPLERNPAILSLKSFREQTVAAAAAAAVATPQSFMASPYSAVLQQHQTVPTQQHQTVPTHTYPGQIPPQQDYPYSSLHCPSNQTQQTQTSNSPNERPEERRRLTREQKKVLEAVFKLDPRPSANTKRTLAGELGMSLRSVQMWFQNQRARLRKHNKDPTPSPATSSPSYKLFSAHHHATDQWAERSEGCERNRPATPTHSLVFHNMRAKTKADGAFLLVAEDWCG